MSHSSGNSYSALPDVPLSRRRADAYSSAATSKPSVDSALGAGGRVDALAGDLVGWGPRLQAAAASRPLVYLIFSVLYLVPTLFLASRKLFWDDEFFTVYLSRVAGWGNLLHALGTGADQHPPSFYYLTHGVTQLLGTTHIAVRLPEIAGYWLLCVCMYEIVRHLAAPCWALVGMLFPLTTHLYLYATEARAYGLVCGFGALATLAWMRATLGERRPLYLSVLGAALAAAVACHYYSVMITLCLILGEVTRTLIKRKVDTAVWAAFTCTVLPLVVFARTIRSARGYSTHFWAVPAWTDSLRFYGLEIALGAVGVVGAVAMLSCLDRGLWREGGGQGGASAPELAPSVPLWWPIAFCSLTLLPFVVMVMAKFVTHGFSDRYTIGAIIGISALIPWFLSVATPQPRYALAALAGGLVLFWFQTHQLHDEIETVRQMTAVDLKNLSETGNQTIAVMDVTKFHRASFYGPRALATRLVYVSDPEASIEYLGHDTVDRGLMDLRPWFPLQVVPASEFLGTHRTFLVYGTVTHWSWLTFRMPRWGDARLLGRDKGLSMMFAVDQGRPAALSPRATLGDDALFDQMPTSGSSLCTLYMGAARCAQEVIVAAEQ